MRESVLTQGWSAIEGQVCWYPLPSRFYHGCCSGDLLHTTSLVFEWGSSIINRALAPDHPIICTDTVLPSPSVLLIG